VAGATRHVAPTGVFQPPANLPPAQDENFDLWRCAVREYAEEFLCEEEARSHEGFAFDYDSEPYRGLMVARRDGSAVPLVLGIAFDPLTWCAEILCAVIFEARTFDRVFAEMKPRNLEGSFLGLRRPSSSEIEGIPFRNREIDQHLDSGLLAPGAVGCLRAAQMQRHELERIAASLARGR
jgi:hypothetical protein